MSQETQPLAQDSILSEDSELDTQRRDTAATDVTQQSEKMTIVLTAADEEEVEVEAEDKTKWKEIADAIVIDEDEVKEAFAAKPGPPLTTSISPRLSPAPSPQISPQSTLQSEGNKPNYLGLSPQKITPQVSMGRTTSLLPNSNAKEQAFKISDSYRDNWKQYMLQPTVQATVREEELYFADPDAPRRVYVMMKIKRLSDVNNADQTYRAKFHIYFNWVLTESEYRDYLQNKNDFTPSFVPLYDFANIVEQFVNEAVDYGGKGPYRVQKVKDFKEDLVGFDPKAAYFVRTRIEVDATFQETFELERYPFDCQDLTIILKEKSGIKKAIFVPELRTLKNGDPADFVKVDGSISNIDEYDLENCMVQFGESNASDSKSKTVYSQIYVSMKLARKWRVVLIDTSLVIFLVILLSFAGFAISYEDIADRLAYTLTLMLTAVLFDSKNVPTPYLTFMDVYVLACYVYLTLIMIQNSLGAFDWYSEEADTVCLYVFLGIFVAMHVFFVVRGVSVRRGETVKLDMCYDEVEAYNNINNPIETPDFIFTWDDLLNGAAKLKGADKWIAFTPRVIDDSDDEES